VQNTNYFTAGIADEHRLNTKIIYHRHRILSLQQTYEAQKRQSKYKRKKIISQQILKIKYCNDY
jgi:hypothetical protein